MKTLFVMQNGMIDFQKNREMYRQQKGISDMLPGELDSHINQNDIEDEFVMVNKSSMVDPNKVRKSHIVRQIEEAQLGARPEDYDADGKLNL